MMAKNQKLSRDKQDKADMEKMQKRVENLLPPKADIPAPISIQQAEELKSRVAELEAELEESRVKQQSPAPEMKERVSEQAVQEVPVEPVAMPVGSRLSLKFSDLSLRTKLLLGFLSVLVLASLGGLFAIIQQSGAAETTAVAEASNLAEALSSIATGNQLDLQQLIIEIHESQGRDVEVVGPDLRILAAAAPEDIGTIFDVDSNGEVAATLKDGQTRTFLEISPDFPRGIQQIVVPVGDEATGKIFAAIILDYAGTMQQVSFAEAVSFAEEVSATIANDPASLQTFISVLFTARQRDLVVVDLQSKVLAEANPAEIGTIFDHDQNGEVAATFKDGQTRSFIEISPEFPQGIQQTIAPIKDSGGNIIGAAIVGSSAVSEQNAIEEASQIADTLEAAVFQSLGSLQETVARLSESQGRDTAVVDSNLLVLADAAPEDIGTIFDVDQNGEVAATLKDGQTRTFVEISPDFPQGIKQVAVPIRDDSGKITGAVIMEYTALFEKLQQAQNTVVRTLVFLSLAGLVLAFVIGQFISSSIANPITRLSDAALKIGSGQLDTPLPALSSKDEVGALTSAFRSMTSRLRGTLVGLTERTHDLEVASEVGRAISKKVENVSAMLTEATELIRSRFNLYYTQVYLLDQSGQTITLRAGTGEAGRQLLQRGHHLLVSSSSLNGRAVSEKKPVIVADTGKSGTFLPNPLLPNTRSEMAIPLLVGDKVLGVLDMQSEMPDALNENNLAAFQVLAGQLSVAIQNATLFAQSEEARKQLEENARQISTVGWQDYLNGTDRGEKIGYVFDQTEVKPLERKNKAKSDNALSVPIMVTGATVGSIQVTQDERKWTSSETLIVQSTADQLAQHIENLRLLSQAERFRQEAEQTTHRLTREGWEGYMQTRGALAAGYSFNPNEIKTGDENIEVESSSTRSLPINVRDEAIGELTINAENIDHQAMDEIFSAVAAQLGDHIESLRLIEETEASRLETQKSQEQYALAVSGSNDGIWDWDIANEQIYYSPRWKSMLGFEEHELTRGFQDWEDLIHPEDHEYATTALNNYLEQKAEAYDVELRLRHKDGTWRWIRDRGKALRDENGKAFRMAGSHSDITEGKRADEIIAQRANQLETVATVSSTAATVLDPDKLLQAVVDLTKERFNLYHAHIYLADESWNTLLLAAGAGEIGRQMVSAGWAIPINHEQSIVAKVARNRQFVIANNMSRDKQTAFLSNYLLPDTRSEMAVPMIVGEKLLGVFDVQADSANFFTEEDANIYTTLAAQVAVALQNARSYVEQAATVTQLRELDRLKSSFLANMSHELRTPLNSILGFADVILEGLDGPLTENMNSDLGLIQKNGQHLLHLINDVLDMAKIDSGKMNLHVEKFNVHELLTDVISITSSLAKEKSLALFIESYSDREVEINADKIRLRQVMINLVNNAMKFTEKGSVSICVTHAIESVLISVNDTGIGIPLDQVEAVFQEFTQVDTTTTRKAGGTGLGLPISRRLVNMHSGRLWAESSGINGEGSTFHVYLPIEANINENATLTAK